MIDINGLRMVKVLNPLSTALGAFGTFLRGTFAKFTTAAVALGDYLHGINATKNKRAQNNTKNGTF